MRFEVATPSGSAVVEFDRPRAPAKALLVLTHGASGGVETVDLRAIRDAAVRAGIVVARVLQPHRSAPPGAPKQDDAWLAAVAGIRKRRGCADVPLVVGGRSNGARLACRTAVAVGAQAVVALAFPVHPPGKPETSRLGELDAAQVPVLVVQGDRDPFGMPPAGKGRQIVVMPGSGHSLRSDPTAVASHVVGFVTAQIATA
jgi:hypothetical protein